MDSFPWFGNIDSWHRKHVMIQCLVRSRLLLVGLDRNQWHGYRHSQGLPAIEHQKRRP
uniref:Uncharacterized protein n=1 Tax=Fagus sylvatica TaxID=28930 RepID=A0A2N9IU16_FAGSY